MDNMEFEIVEGLIVRENIEKVPVYLYPKNSKYKFPEKVKVPVTKRSYKIISDSISSKLSECKSIVSKCRPKSFYGIYTHQAVLPNLTRDISYRTDKIVGSLEDCSKAFSILIRPNTAK